MQFRRQRPSLYRSCRLGLLLTAVSLIVWLYWGVDGRILSTVRRTIETQPRSSSSASVRRTTQTQPRIRDQTVVLPPYNCTAEEIAQANASEWFKDLYRREDMRNGLWCAGDWVMDAIHELDPSRIGKVFLNIGANKGYVVAAATALWAPEAGVSSASLGDYWRPIVGAAFCGGCADCKRRYANTSSLYVGPTSATLGGVEDLRLVAVEPAPITFSFLASSPLFSGASAALQRVAVVLNAAGGARPGGSLLMQNCTGTTGGCQVGAGLESQAFAVPQVTVDELIFDGIAEGSQLALHGRLPLMEPLRSVFWLHIDAEGWDPLVIRGAHRALSEGRVEIFVFEYNKFGPWREYRLRDVITWADGWSYTCFLLTAPHLRLLTRCWHGGYETHEWSNVVCVHRRRPDVLDLLYARSTLSHVRAGESTGSS